MDPSSHPTICSLSRRRRRRSALPPPLPWASGATPGPPLRPPSRRRRRHCAVVSVRLGPTRPDPGPDEWGHHVLCWLLNNSAIQNLCGAAALNHRMASFQNSNCRPGFGQVRDTSNYGRRGTDKRLGKQPIRRFGVDSRSKFINLLLAILVAQLIYTGYKCSRRATALLNLRVWVFTEKNSWSMVKLNLLIQNTEN